MAGFTVHATTALVASTGAAAYLSAYESYPWYWGATLCSLGVLGGLLPDTIPTKPKSPGIAVFLWEWSLFYW